MTDEHIEAIRFTVEQTKNRIPVVAGTGSNDTKYAIELSKGLKVSYLRPSSRYHTTIKHLKGLVTHFTAIADAVNIPIILYNILVEQL